MKNNAIKTAADEQKYSNGLLPFLPMLYVAWADGVLLPSEIDFIRTHIDRQNWLTAEEKSTLKRWTDPNQPPSSRTVRAWLRVIRQHGNCIDGNVRMNLSELGLEMARLNTDKENSRCSGPLVCAALDEIEQALGVYGEQAVEELLEKSRPLKPAVPLKPIQPFSAAGLQKLLDGEHAGLKNEIRRLLDDASFRLEFGLSKEEKREQTYKRCMILARRGFGAIAFPEAFGGQGDISQSIAVFETLAYHDLSTTVKFGVQFGLFAGSIYQLGTEKHHKKYLKDAASLKLPGCFAMTENGHGSNVRDIETTAVYDVETEEFIINTPHESARKEYIGNSALHGRLATVFAQLFIADECYGVHAFLVPIRSGKGKTMPGVRISDNGEKMGLNGVDNGRLWFDQVRIPRENLLDRFASVSKEGMYNSAIASDSARFFTMLGTLVGGRISVAAGASSAAKTALASALKYAALRRQFGPPNHNETRLLDYPSHQRRLIPLLAKTYAIEFALKDLKHKYHKKQPGQAREIESSAAAIKAYSTWHTTKTIQICREACGGAGYLAENRFADLKADSDVFTTFEGDNTVLMQLVAKSLLTDYKQQFQDGKYAAVLKLIVDRAATAVSEKNPVTIRRTDSEHLRDPEFHRAALEYREQHLLETAAARIRKYSSEGMTVYQAFIRCQTHLLALAGAYVERYVNERFDEFVRAMDAGGMKSSLRLLQNLSALYSLENDLGWFLEHGYVDGSKSKALRREVDSLIGEIVPFSEALVDAFAIPRQSYAPIALGTDLEA